MKNKNHLHPFIHSMFLRNSINAAVARNPIYSNNATQVQKRNFRESCKQRLVELGVRYYVWEWNLESYTNEITSFSNSISHSHGQLLTIGRLNIGTSQKMVSLYLKYLWLDGDPSKKPIGAVLDRGIIVESGYPNPPDWTKLDDINVYRDIQLAISEKASSQGYGSAAVWEAEKWGSE
jgi:hypothetical protein